MASLSTDRQGNRRILYSDPVIGKRRTLYVGKMSEPAAVKFLAHVETLIAHRKTGEPFAPATVRWIAELPAALARKLADAALIPPRPSEKTAPLA